MKRLLFCLPVILLSACATASSAATSPEPAPAPKPASPLEVRVEQLIPFVSGKIAPEAYVTPGFMQALPSDQFSAFLKTLVGQIGQPIKIVEVERFGPNLARVTVEFEKAIAPIEIRIEANAPNLVSEFLVKPPTVKGDNIEKISSDFKALPGQAGFVVQLLNEEAETAQINAQQQFAIGSVFKLYVLAELASQIEAGQRKWSDVVLLDRLTYSSPATDNWPRGTPVTLQTLATWMISVSDNAATDQLIYVLGRDAVEQKLASIGHSAPDKTLPLLTTVEAFVLKSNPGLLARFEKATEAQQRDMLDNETVALSYDNVDLSKFGSAPLAINSVEWFASPADISLLLNHLRRINSKTALDIMGVNKGVVPTSAAKWQYLGYKGGSESGVIAMSFLAQSKGGEWYAISGAWNNPAKEVDNAAFAALMTRLLDNVAN